MNKNFIKGLLFGAIITGYIAYRYYGLEVNKLNEQINAQLKALQEKNTQNTKPETDKFIKLGQKNCILIKDLRNSLNFLFERTEFEDGDFYNETLLQKLKPVFDGTENILQEDGSLRKSFIYDINKTIANAIDVDIQEFDFNNEYETGLIQKGSKGLDVKTLQELINKIYQNDDLEVNGTYNKETYAKVIKLFSGTTALFDAETGAISKQFIHNFSKIISNINY